MRLFRRHSSSWDESSPDEYLVGRWLAGERAAFDALYERYLMRIYRYCFRCLGDQAAAEDATQTTFHKALAALPSFGTGSFERWLFRIARNVVSDERTRRARQCAVPFDDAVDA